MIVSAIDGRIRFVDPGLKSPARAESVEKRLQQAEGITCARVNRQTGSLLVIYDSAAAGGRSIRNTIGRSLKEAGIGRSPYSLNQPTARRYVKFGLIGTITGSIGFLLLVSDEWHYRLGTAFLTLLSVHLYQNRRRLLK